MLKFPKLTEEENKKIEDMLHFYPSSKWYILAIDNITNCSLDKVCENKVCTPRFIRLSLQSRHLNGKKNLSGLIFEELRFDDDADKFIEIKKKYTDPITQITDYEALNNNFTFKTKVIMVPVEPHYKVFFQFESSCTCNTTDFLEKRRIYKFIRLLVEEGETWEERLIKSKRLHMYNPIISQV